MTAAASTPNPAEINALADRNATAFVWFRIFYNARFYYPVFMILFLDFGLTVDQFSWLNAVWAVAIVVLEVPSGALADIVGRRNLVIVAALLMVAEMAVLCIVPVDAAGWVLAAFILNRVLSGASEAAASGADEALAYDSLHAAGRAGEWTRVLERTARRRSVAMFTAMITGALLYDPATWNAAFAWLGMGMEWTTAQTVKIPLYLTFVGGLVALGFALRMQEPPGERSVEPTLAGMWLNPFRNALRTGKWILKNRAVWLIIGGAMLLDHVTRFSVTATSEYLRLCGYTESLLGPVNATFALVALFLAGRARWCTENQSPQRNLFMLIGIALVGLTGQALALPYWSLIFVYIIFGTMVFVEPMVSTYLNHFAPPKERATVLSFKGLVMNIGYGSFGLLFAQLYATVRGVTSAGQGGAFLASLGFLPAYFVAAAGLYLLLARIKKPGSFAQTPLKAMQGL